MERNIIFRISFRDFLITLHIQDFVTVWYSSENQQKIIYDSFLLYKLIYDFVVNFKSQNSGKGLEIMGFLKIL